MSFTDYSEETRREWASLIVDFGFTVDEATKRIGMLPEDVEEFEMIHLKYLKDAKFNKWRNDMFGILQLTTLMANVNRDTDKKDAPFTMNDFMPLTREELEQRQKQQMEEGLRMLEMM